MLKVNSRRIMLYLAGAGIALILALVGFSLFLKPAMVDLDNQPEEERKSEPPKPVKKPPLD